MSHDLYENLRNDNNPTDFIHVDQKEDCLTLHDCIADNAYFRDGVLGFEFSNGFWITPNHPASDLPETVRTDFSRVEYLLEPGEEYNIGIYVFNQTIFGRTVRNEWPIGQLVHEIHNGHCTLEFLYQYTDSHGRMIECELHFPQKPFRKECLIKIPAQKATYYWNRLCADKRW